MIDIKIVNNDIEELKKVYRLRYNIYLNEYDAIKPNSKQLEYDKFDKYSCQIAIYKDNKFIGTTRYIHNSPIGYPVEELYNTDILKPYKFNEIGELSRFMIDKDYRGLQDSLDLFRHNYNIIKDISENYGIKIIVGAFEMKFIRLLKIMGLEFDYIGEAKFYYGADRYLATFNPYQNI